MRSCDWDCGIIAQTSREPVTLDCTLAGSDTRTPHSRHTGVDSVDTHQGSMRMISRAEQPSIGHFMRPAQVSMAIHTAPVTGA